MILSTPRQHVADDYYKSRGRQASAVAVADPGVLRRCDDHTRLWGALRDLPPLQGAALLLSVGFEVPRPTVASLLGVPQTSVSRLCARALRMVRARARVIGAEWQ